MLFNCLIRGIMIIINGSPVGIDNDQEYYKAIIKKANKDDKSKGTPKMYVSIPIGFTVVVQQEDGGPWTHGMIEGKVIKIIMADHTTFTSQKQAD